MQTSRDFPQRAHDVLEGNVSTVNLFDGLRTASFTRTVPSRQFYVHQWNWDSATHALGLVGQSPDRAIDELLSLVSGQWENGMIAQITFNPGETKYYPGPQFWGTESFRRGEIQTSGISQPPIIAYAVAHIYKTIQKHHPEVFQKRGQDLLRLADAAFRFLSFLHDIRDPEQSGLITVVHPWESGLDNAPTWDAALSCAELRLDRIPQTVKEEVATHRTDIALGASEMRPHAIDYYRYIALVHLFRNLNWDQKAIVEKSPFAVKDVLFSSIFARGCEAMSALYAKIEVSSERAEKLRKWYEHSCAALRLTWNDELSGFLSQDCRQPEDSAIREESIALFAPLFAGIALSPDQGTRLLAKLRDPSKFWTAYPVPTVPLDSPKFDMNRYWRGPTWPITNLLLIEGLLRYPEFKQTARELRQKTLQMIEKGGFWEYFHPVSGSVRGDDTATGIGFGEFSWTAAIYLYLRDLP